MNDRGMTTDVVELILTDHRRFEELFRQLRSEEDHRRTRQGMLSALLVAHAVAEDGEVYPALRQHLGNDVIEHGEEEHLEGHQALLALLEVDEVGSRRWTAALDELERTIGHHLDEEETTILDATRKQVPAAQRAELGGRFLQLREDALDSDCGSLARVRKLVEAAESGQPNS